MIRWRPLQDFQVGDRIHRWGDNLLIIKVERLEQGQIRLTYRDTDGNDKSISNHETAEFIVGDDPVTE
jgi:hypothetical protein